MQGIKECYRVPIIKVSNYSVDDLFKKRLMALVPYYILRYESFLKSNSTDEKKTEALLDDMRLIAMKLEECYKDDESTYVDLINLTLQICSYIIPDENQVKRKVGDVMGGKVLKLRSEILKEEGFVKGHAEGHAEGRTDEIFLSVQEGDYGIERGAKKLGISVTEFEKRMEAAGYKVPVGVSY